MKGSVHPHGQSAQGVVKSPPHTHWAMVMRVMSDLALWLIRTKNSEQNKFGLMVNWHKEQSEFGLMTNRHKERWKKVSLASCSFDSSSQPGKHIPIFILTKIILSLEPEESLQMFVGVSQKLLASVHKSSTSYTNRRIFGKFTLRCIFFYVYVHLSFKSFSFLMVFVLSCLDLFGWHVDLG